MPGVNPYFNPMLSRQQAEAAGAPQVDYARGGLKTDGFNVEYAASDIGIPGLPTMQEPTLPEIASFNWTPVIVIAGAALAAWLIFGKGR